MHCIIYFHNLICALNWTDNRLMDFQVLWHVSTAAYILFKQKRWLLLINIRNSKKKKTLYGLNLLCTRALSLGFMNYRKARLNR